MNVTEKSVLMKMAIPQLPALDLEEAVHFYEDKLGFKQTASYPGFAIVARDHVELHLWLCTDKFVPENSSCYIHVENIEELYRDLSTDRAVRLQEKLEKRPWGMKQFSVLDPSGNALRFGELLTTCGETSAALESREISL